MSKAAPGPREIALRQMREAKYEKKQQANRIFGYERDDIFVFGEPMQAAHKRILADRARKPKKPPAKVSAKKPAS